MQIKLPILVLTAVTSVCSAQAQEKWDLKKCVEYALENNITIKQTDLQSKIAAVDYEQSRLGQLPTLSFGGSGAFNSGRNQDPTTFGLVTESYLSAGFQLQSNADIFNFFSKKNNVLAYRWQLEAAKAGTDKLKNDIALAVANSYLQILLNKEQEKIAGVQLEQTRAQLGNTRKLVNAGSLPELNASELEAQFARDSANLITATGNVQLAVLQLKAQMYIDAATPFEVVEPPVEAIPVEKIADLQPADVYALAIKNLPQQRVNYFNLKAAQKSADAARGAMLPSLSAFGGLSSNFINRKFPVTAFAGTYSTSLIGPQVDVNGTIYKLYVPDTYISGSRSEAFFTQLDNNFRQQVGLSISVPVLNGGALKSNWKRSKLNIINAEYQQQIDAQKIKQDIYQAYTSALVALEKFSASQKSVDASQRTYDFAKKRYDVGMLSTFELITNQNNLFRAKLEMVLNQFDYVFKMKVLEFYRGQGLKL